MNRNEAIQSDQIFIYEFECKSKMLSLFNAMIFDDSLCVVFCVQYENENK